MGWFRRTPPSPQLQNLSAADYFDGLAAWQPVASSNLHSVAFYGQGERGILAIRFKDAKTGGVKSEYRYSDVPLDVYQALMGAPSHGVYFHANIRAKYLTAGPL